MFVEKGWCSVDVGWNVVFDYVIVECIVFDD